MSTKKIKQLFMWMEENLKQSSTFSVDAISDFFADKFVILTNARYVEATPKTYHEYLYQLKNRLHCVSYDFDDWVCQSDKVVCSFTITMDFVDKQPQKLLAISIFTFDKDIRITEWREVFTPIDDNQFVYDKE